MLSIPLVAVTQCQLSWALLATIGCSAVSRDHDVGEDHEADRTSGLHGADVTSENPRATRGLFFNVGKFPVRFNLLKFFIVQILLIELKLSLSLFQVITTNPQGLRKRNNRRQDQTEPLPLFRGFEKIFKSK